MPNNQYPNSTLGQTAINPKQPQNLRAPDTDSRLIKIINGATTVAPNLMHDHTRFEYIIPTGNAVPVNFNNPVNTEDRSLHWIVLDNSNNSSIVKVFNFSPSYVFLDDPGNTTNSYNLDPNKKLVWFGTFTNGKLYLRVASESTN
jgi:hypothetical protein